METTFITIHNLSPDANILYVSESIVEILGYNPEEVIGRSCFEYFHPDEIPFARDAHNRGVRMDKAAVLHYARIRSRNGHWVGCECVFTVVSDVLISCTSIYKANEKSRERALDAPAVRRLFAATPRDPRYHMLEHLSAKFKDTPSQESAHEPRAALILNRFSRELPVMFATNAVEDILGIRVDQTVGKSFYECIQENCHRDAIRCLESAKANDSIAYLRFWYRNPKRDEDHEDDNEETRSQTDSSSDSDGGVELNSVMDYDQDDDEIAIKIEDTESQSNYFTRNESQNRSLARDTSDPNSRTSSGLTSQMEHDAAEAIFDAPLGSRSSTSSIAPDLSPPLPTPYEIEAVVSCSSDGLVVVLRRVATHASSLASQTQANTSGIFSAPWAQQPILPIGVDAHLQQRSRIGGDQRAHHVLSGGPSREVFDSIRDVAVFAWSVVGINGNIASYGRGVPRGEAQPNFGLPIWEPNAQPAPAWSGPFNQAVSRWTRFDESLQANFRLPGQMPDLIDNNQDIQRSHAHNTGLGHQAHRYQQRFYPSAMNQVPNVGATSLYNQIRQYHDPQEIDFEYQNWTTRGFHPRPRQRRFQRAMQNGLPYSEYTNGNYTVSPQQRYRGASQQGPYRRHPMQQNPSSSNYNNNRPSYRPQSRDIGQRQTSWNTYQAQQHLQSTTQTLGGWNDFTGIVQSPNRQLSAGWATTMVGDGTNGHSRLPDGTGDRSPHFRKTSG